MLRTVPQVFSQNVVGSLQSAGHFACEAFSQV
jgi:hypothetical protein